MSSSANNNDEIPITVMNLNDTNNLQQEQQTYSNSSTTSSSSTLLTIPTLSTPLSSSSLNISIPNNNNNSPPSTTVPSTISKTPILLLHQTKRNNSSAILQAQQLHLGLLEAPTPTFTTSKLSPRKRNSITMDINNNNNMNNNNLNVVNTNNNNMNMNELNNNNSSSSSSLTSFNNSTTTISTISNNNDNNISNSSSSDNNNSTPTSLNSSLSNNSSSNNLNSSPSSSNISTNSSTTTTLEDNLAHSILYQYEKLHQKLLVPLFFILTYLYLCIETTDYHWTMAICCFIIMAINLPHFRDALQSTVIEKIILIHSNSNLNNLNNNLNNDINNSNSSNNNNSNSNNNNILDENKKQDIIYKIYTYKIVIIVNISLQFFRLIISNKNPTYSWMTIGFMASTVHNLSSFILHNSIALGDNGLSTALWTILPLNILSIGTSLILCLYFNRYSESFGVLTMLTIFNLVFNTTSYKLMEKLNMMNIMTGRLKDANKSKNSLVSSISHEFRSPLMSISGCIELLLDTKLTEDQIQYLKTIGCCSSILLTLIEDILQYSKLEKGNLEIANSIEDSNHSSIFSLGECIEHVKSITTTYAQNFNVKINVQISKFIPTFVIGESVRLQQVLINLLTNAVKASHSNGIVTLKVETIEDFNNTININNTINGNNNTINNNNNNINDNNLNNEDKKSQLVTFKIIDQGKGIPKNVQELLFKPFFSGFLNSSSTTCKSAVMGTGLGLSIAKKIVNYNFKGELSYESNIIPPNTGTTFIVKIPFILPDHRKKNSLKYIEEMLKHSNNSSNNLNLNNLNSSNNSSNNLNNNILLNNLNENNDQKSHLLHKELFMLKPINNSTIKRNIYELPILLAEDNPINLLVLKRLLEKGGFTNIVTCSNGLELVEEFKKKFYDLIITDLHMPLMSGIEASNMIRKLPNGLNTKIIMLTADALLDKLEFMESIDASLNKPITSENLNKAVKSVLS